MKEYLPLLAYLAGGLAIGVAIKAFTTKAPVA